MQEILNSLATNMELSTKAPKYLSPSAFLLHRRDPDLYVKRYIADPSLPWDPQSEPMALGSAFDAFVKNELVRCFYGGSAVKRGTEFHLETLFKHSVDEKHWEWAWEAGGWAFLQYKDSGAFDDLLSEMEDYTEEPHFEERLEATITLPSGFQIPILGNPDAWYRNKLGRLVILDWKCTGFRSKSNVSPYKHFILQRPKMEAYKDAEVIKIDNITINKNICFSEVSTDWAVQIVLYSWMLGEPVGKSSVVAQIDQVLLKSPKTKEEELRPDCRVITYRGLISPEFQLAVAEQLEKTWKAVQAGYVYLDKTEKEAKQRVQQMVKLAKMEIEHNPILMIVRGARGKGKFYSATIPLV